MSNLTSFSANSLILQLASIVDPLPLAALFPKEQPVEVELGSGDGSFLVKYASTHPDRNFLGVERLKGRLRKVDRKSLRAGLQNVRGVRVEAGYLLEYLLPPGSVSALHVYFPDPWPKRKHQKRRLVNERFPGLAARVLAPGGRVFFRTDDQPYFTQMRAFFVSRGDFREVEMPSDLAENVTDFEKEFLAKGLPINRLAYEKEDSGVVPAAVATLFSKVLYTGNVPA